MQINFTKEEYRSLLDMLHIADWVIHAHKKDIESGELEYQTVHMKLLSYYKEMESTDIVKYSEEDQEYFPSPAYEEKMLTDFIFPYDNNVFWVELIDRLSTRDLIQEIGPDEYDALNPDERADKVLQCVEEYENEFEEHGLQNIEVVRDEVYLN